MAKHDANAAAVDGDFSTCVASVKCVVLKEKFLLSREIILQTSVRNSTLTKQPKASCVFTRQTNPVAHVAPLLSSVCPAYNQLTDKP